MKATGIDLVQAQFRLASGQSLGAIGLAAQGDVPPPRGFAVQARVVDGPGLGHPPGTCLLTLTVFRAAGVGDDTWERLWHVFETEIHMIRGRLEVGWR